MKLVLDGVRLPLAHFELDVTAEIAAPVTGIFGPSGAGKTTLLDLIAGLRKPVGGRVLFDSVDVTRVAPRHRGIGYVPQENALFPHLSVEQNIRYGRLSGAAGALARRTVEHPPGEASAAPLNDEARVVRVLEIEPLLGRGVTNLSGGEQKRVALARALLASPRLLLLDEPLAGVDRPLQARIAELLARIRDELRIPMIYVTHDEGELARLATETIVVDRGRVMSRR